jgi:hypothetical protein
MSRALGKWVAVLAVAMAALSVCAGLASASSAFQLSIAPTHLKPGGSVTISTTPRESCTLTITLAKKPFSHPMANGWIKVAMPAKDILGRVPVKVNCGGHVETGSFTVSK